LDSRVAIYKSHPFLFRDAIHQIRFHLTRMEFESELRRFSLAYTSIRSIFFLYNPDTIDFHLVLQLTQPEPIFEDGEDRQYSHVLMRLRGDEKTELRLNPAYRGALPLILVDEAEQFMGCKWDKYRAMAKVLQWMSHCPMSVGGFFVGSWDACKLLT